VPLFVPNRHTRDEVKAALAALAAMDERQRAQLADAIDGAPLTPQHRAVLFRLQADAGRVALGRPAPPGESSITDRQAVGKPRARAPRRPCPDPSDSGADPALSRLGAA
jgi:hypothetical protein